MLLISTYLFYGQYMQSNSEKYIKHLIFREYKWLGQENHNFQP